MHQFKETILSNLGSKKNINLLDVTNLSLGIEVKGEKMSVIIKRSTPLPCDGEEIYKTCNDNQTSIGINIYEGESNDIKDNWLLDYYSIENLPKKPAGEAKIKIKFEIDYNSILKVTAFDLSNEKNKKQLIVKKPQGLRKIMNQLKDYEKKMKDIEYPDYINYKEKIIDFQEKINKSKNEKENLKNLIIELEKLINNAKLSEPKMFISYVKYFFQKINQFIKISNNSFEQNFISNIKKDIDEIFENIQFYDSNILNEIIEDFIDNELLYEYCLYKLVINYYEKAEYSYFYTDKLIKQEKLDDALDTIQESKDYICISKQKYEKIKDKTIILPTYKKSIEDYEIKIEVKIILINFKNGKKFENNNIQELIDKYSKCYNIEYEDYQKLIEIAKMEEKDFEDADNFEKKLDIDFFQNENLTKEDTLYYINERLIFILNSYPPESIINKRTDIIIEIKNAVNSKNPKEMISIIQQLRGNYQESLNNLNKITNEDVKKGFKEFLYNKILIFLNKLTNILEKI